MLQRLPPKCPHPCTQQGAGESWSEHILQARRARLMRLGKIYAGPLRASPWAACEPSWALCSLSWPSPRCSPTGGRPLVYSRMEWVRESGGENVWSCWLEVSLAGWGAPMRSRGSPGQSPLLDSCPDPSCPSLLASGGSPLPSLHCAHLRHYYSAPGPWWIDRTGRSEPALIEGARQALD